MLLNFIENHLSADGKVKGEFVPVGTKIISIMKSVDLYKWGQKDKCHISNNGTFIIIAKLKMSHLRERGEKKMLAVVDWSKINPDILAQIISRLELIDFIRSSVVCQSWRSTIFGGSYFCRPKPGPMPLLVLSSPEEPEFKYFYNLADPTTLNKVNLFDISNHVIIGSSGGYIITIDDVGRIHATNPITKAHRLLPDPTNLPHFWGALINPYCGKIPYLLQPLGILDYCPYNVENICYYYHKVVISPDRYGSKAVFILYSLRELVFARENESSWTEITDSLCNFADVLFHKGLLYAVCYTGELFGFDLDCPLSPNQDIFIADAPKGINTIGKKYLVESLCCSEIFLIAKDITNIPPNEDDDIYGYHQTLGFNVYRLNQTKHEWIEVGNFGDDVVVFVGYNHAIMRPIRDFPGRNVRKNCIYFTDDSYAIDCKGEIFCEDSAVFCMDSRTIMPLDMNGYDLQHFSFPPPVWFVPNFY